MREDAILPGQLAEESDEAEKQSRSPQLGERLFKARTILIYGGINQKLAERVSAQMLALQAESDEPITIFINSQGGHVESGDTIYDMIKFVKPEVRVIGTGWVASAGALIYAAAKVENRLSLPNTRFLLHQPSGGAGGSASEIEIHAREIIRMRERLNEIFARETGQSVERIAADTERDYWMSAEAAKDYGLVGRIIKSASDLG
ncbi:ATP-dependent Clp protease proteolytic subunit [Oleiagrimonas sp. C23AA]|uniref:ATP-dependent Clp protease proteolytic subunit n=1 Tax=Oleiagrimonas sp. C23AA TaxID=2719047 RepID=UPI00142143F3|nr:ATP-dependent Clp protease proteolytic subunit [Oleiagrimonas sp. C23AA]NII10104.1 ATP-dependent Clp protease proteolytic subunit [Oleiagrimonas sp. C23AA]